MKTAIFETIGNIDPDLIKQAKEHCPRDGLKQDLGNSNTQDIRVNFANTQTACILHENNKLLSFSSIGQDELFTNTMATAMNLNPHECMSLLYLFTTSPYKHQGNAQYLGKEIIHHIKTNYPHIKYLIGSTGSDYAQSIYQKYGSQKVEVNNKQLLIELEINNQYFFKYPIT